MEETQNIVPSQAKSSARVTPTRRGKRKQAPDHDLSTANDEDDPEKMYFDISNLLSPDPDTVQEAMQGLVDLNFHDQPKNEQIRTEAVCGGAILGVLTAMKTHPDVAMIQEDGLNLLSALGVEAPEAFHSTIHCMGGIEATLQAMEKFPWKEPLLDNGLHVLDNELCDKKNVSRLIKFDDADGMSVILATAQNHKTSLAIQKWFCYVLSRVEAFDLEDNRDMRVKLRKALEQAMQSINAHPDDEELSKAVKALVNKLL